MEKYENLEEYAQFMACMRRHIKGKTTERKAEITGQTTRKLPLPSRQDSTRKMSPASI